MLIYNNYISPINYDNFKIFSIVFIFIYILYSLYLYLMLIYSNL